MGSYNIMIDIETMGVNPRAPIISIGAIDTDGVAFHRYLDVQSQISQGAVVDWSTVYWWMQQSDEARKALRESGDSPEIVLEDLARAYKWNDAEVWCNGASFDFPIIESAYLRVGSSVPWKYFQTRDLRTVTKLFGGLVNRHKAVLAHDALSDAEAQMATLREIEVCLVNLKQAFVKA